MATNQPIPDLFQSTLSRRERQLLSQMEKMRQQFQSTLSRRERLKDSTNPADFKFISIHALPKRATKIRRNLLC